MVGNGEGVDCGGNEGLGVTAISVATGGAGGMVIETVEIGVGVTAVWQADKIRRIKYKMICIRFMSAL